MTDQTDTPGESGATATSDRLYTPEELDAYASQQAAVPPAAQESPWSPQAPPAPQAASSPSGATPSDALARQLVDPLGDPWPSAPAPAPVAAPVPDAAPVVPVPAVPAPFAPVPAVSAPIAGPQPSAPPAGPPPSAPPVAAPSGPPPAVVPPAAVAPAAPPSAPPAAPPAAVEPRRFMTATDFLDRRDSEQELGPATWGWRGRVRRWSGGTIKPAMGTREVAYETDRSAIQRDFDGPRTIVFINPKGGAAKTTGVLATGYTFGTVRGGGVVAWDNNETRGTLGIRGTRSSHRNTTRELLEDLERFEDVYQSRIGDLGAFVRSQGDAHFDVLASDERPDVTGTIRAVDFKQVHALLERFYRVILVDTGNNMRAENWLAAAEAADLLVVTSTVREDTGYSGLWMLDALQDAGLTDLKRKCVTVLSDPSPQVDSKLAADLVQVYEQRTRAVYRVPYDPVLVAGGVVPYARLSEETRMSWLKACAGMADGL